MTTTLLIDIDGTLVEHITSLPERVQQKLPTPKVLPGVIEKLTEWGKAGHKIILTTARKECWRKLTERELEEEGIWYDQLVMDLGCGPRYVINDLKPGREETPMAVAINLPRNQGIGEIKL